MRAFLPRRLSSKPGVVITGVVLERKSPGMSSEIVVNQREGFALHRVRVDRIKTHIFTNAFSHPAKGRIA
jgi:hypothetical protein